MVLYGVAKPLNRVNRDSDCHRKIRKWNPHPSVLVVGYTSFIALVRAEDTKFAQRKYMATTLRESPRILIFDEQQNPISIDSRLRKCLMKVPTKLRILLSGTLF